MLEELHENVSEWLCYPEALRPSNHDTHRLREETEHSVMLYAHGPMSNQLGLRAVIYPKHEDYPDLYVFKAGGNRFFLHSLDEDQPLPFNHLRGRWSNEFVVQKYYDKLIKLDIA